MKDLSQFGQVEENVSLKAYNTFHIEGICKYLIFPKTIENVKALLDFLDATYQKFFILGNGSNVIISDDYFDGVVISLKELNHLEFCDEEVIVGAGVMMPYLSLSSIRQGLKGLEWAAGIPGTVGGCIYGNAGAYKESTFDYLKDVTVLTPSREIVTFKKSDLSYGYRTSYFKEKSGFIILSATLKLTVGNSDESMQTVLKRKEKRMATQPLEYSSAGSVFRNPSEDLPSGRLIEELGLKGKQIGGAMVSQKHANFMLQFTAQKIDE